MVVFLSRLAPVAGAPLPPDASWATTNRTSGTWASGPEYMPPVAAVPSPEELIRLRHEGDVRFGELAARAAANAAGYSQVDHELQALLEEEGRLQRILQEQQQRIHEGELRLQRASEPDPQMGSYTESLKDSVLAEHKTRATESAAEEVRKKLEEVQLALQHQEEIRRRQEGRLQSLQLRASKLTHENDSLRHEVAAAEARLDHAHEEHVHVSSALRSGVGSLVETSRNTETDLTDVELEASRLDAEVRWYRLRRGEELR
mmetsp:Transcript_10828/g.27997  ORF Transcript_10828/g.27997 Transcript_10828/m.27997 type:complete len:260 (+) Transcript_10828:105-884(+)